MFTVSFVKNEVSGSNYWSPMLPAPFFLVLTAHTNNKEEKNNKNMEHRSIIFILNTTTTTISYHLSIIKSIIKLNCIPYTAGRQRKPSIKTLRSPVAAEFWRHCVLSGVTQRRPFRHQSEASSSGNRTHSQSRLQSHFVPLCHDWPTIYNYYMYYM